MFFKILRLMFSGSILLAGVLLLLVVFSPAVGTWVRSSDVLYPFYRDCMSVRPGQYLHEFEAVLVDLYGAKVSRHQKRVIFSIERYSADLCVVDFAFHEGKEVVEDVAFWLN